MKKLGINEILNKILLVIAYIGSIFITIGACLKLANESGSDVGEGWIIFSVVFFTLLLVLEIPSALISLLSSKNKQGCVTEYNMRYKLYHIPCFVLSIFAWLTIFFKGMSSGTGITTLTAILLVFAGYLVVFRFSISNLVYLLKNYRLRKMKPNVLSVFALIMSFIFFIDVIGAVLLYKDEINQNPDYFEIKKKEYLDFKHRWETGVHMNPKIYYVISILLTIALYILVGNILYLTFKSLFDESTVYAQILIVKIDNEAFINLLVIAFIIALCKGIFAFVYGKLGKKSPLKFVCINKILDAIPTIGLLVASGIFLYEGAKSGLFGYLLLLLMMLIIMFVLALILIIISFIAFAYSGILFATAYMTIMGSTLSVFAYYMNHRKVENRKFASKKIVVCMVLLWIPIADIASLIILRKAERQNKVYGEIPYIVEQE